MLGFRRLVEGCFTKTASHDSNGGPRQKGKSVVRPEAREPGHDSLCSFIRLGRGPTDEWRSKKRFYNTCIPSPRHGHGNCGDVAPNVNKSKQNRVVDYTAIFLEQLFILVDIE